MTVALERTILHCQELCCKVDQLIISTRLCITIIICSDFYIFSLIRTFGALMPGHGETITDEEIWERLPVRIQSTHSTYCSLTSGLCWLVCLPLNWINRTYKLSNISNFWPKMQFCVQMLLCPIKWYICCSSIN